MTTSRLTRRATLRLAGLYVLIFAVSAAVLGATVYLTAQAVLQQEMEGRISSETALLRDEFAGGGLERLAALVRLRGRGASALDYLLQDAQGRHIAGEMPAIAGGLKPGWTTIDVPVASEDDGRPEQVRALVSDVGGGVLLAVGDDLRRIQDVQQSILTALAWAVGLATILAIAGGITLSSLFLARVDAISRTAEAIIAGDLSRRVPVRGSGDDLDTLATTLNRMLDRIERLMESLRQVSSDVAHDLRTPLSRLFQRLEGARNGASSIAEYEVAVEAAMAEAEALLETFAALLRVAQVEGTPSRQGFQRVLLDEIVDAVADAYRPDAEAGGRWIAAEIKPGVAIAGDRELLTQAVANLIENALRHTPPGTRIRLMLTDDPREGATLRIEDDGPGVQEADLERLTDRFYRAERSRSTPGNGLGLTLVAAVVELHGGTLELENAHPGLRVTLRFPVS